MYIITNNQKGFAPIVVLLVVVLIGGVVVGAYYFGKQSVSTKVTDTFQQLEIIPSVQPNPTDELASWQVYKNDELGYSFMYPPTFNQFSDGYLSPKEECTECVTPEGFFPNGDLVNNPNDLPLTELAFKTNEWERNSTEIIEIKDDSSLKIILLVYKEPGSGPMRDAFVLNKEDSKVVRIIFQLEDANLISKILSTIKFTQ